MADAPPPETLYYVPSSDSGSPDGPWSWIAEVAVIACGFVWSLQGNPIDSSVLGGPRFNDEEGRGPFHWILFGCFGTISQRYLIETPARK